jgi:hypothetical protein
VGGYGLTYTVRSQFETRWVFLVQRYHLFPHLGLVLLLAPALGPWLRRLDARPLRTGRGDGPGGRAAGGAPARDAGPGPALPLPGTGRTLAALERLAEICRGRRITRPQALAALDPIRTTWFPHDLNALAMLPETVPAPGLPDALVRPTLLAALTAAEREALCGGMDASPYVRPAATEPVARGLLVGSSHVRPVRRPDRYVSSGRPAYLEFQMIPDGPPSGAGPGRAGRALCVPAAGGPWRSGGRGPRRWSETRSVR